MVKWYVGGPGEGGGSEREVRVRDGGRDEKRKNVTLVLRLVRTISD